MDKVVCPNCGADISVKEPKCPFCGYINVTGAEEKFMRDVQKTEEDLSQIPEMQKTQLKKSLSKSSRIIVVTIVVVIVIALGIVGFFVMMNKAFSASYERDEKEEMMWERENFPILDEIYAEGRYDDILEFQFELDKQNEENNTHHTFTEWEHYDFFMAYEKYAVFKEKMQRFDKNGEVSEFDAEDLVYYGLWYYYRFFDNTYYNYTDEERALLEGYREEILVDLFGRLKFTEEELSSIKEDLMEDDFLELKACWKYAKKIMDRFE